jgi:hypothetical protein
MIISGGHIPARLLLMYGQKGCFSKVSPQGHRGRREMFLTFRLP